MLIKNQRGINLIEVLITIVITTVGLLGIISLQMQSQRSSQDSGNKTQALWILEDLASRMNANSYALDSYNTHGNYVCPNTAPTRCADYYDGSKKQAASCTPEQVAVFDLWNTACSAGTKMGGRLIRQSPADFMTNPILNITTNDDTNSATISLTWDVITSGKKTDGSQQYIIDQQDTSTKRTSTLIREVQL